MRKLGKVIGFLFLSLIGLIILLLVTAKVAEDKIVDVAMEQVSASIQAPVSIDKASFTLIRRFPYATIELDNIRLEQQASDSVNGDQPPLFFLEKAFVSVKTKPLLNYEFEIVKVEIEGGELLYRIDELGKSNIDFLMDTTTVESDTSATLPKVFLEDLRIKDLKLLYQDDSSNIQAQMHIPDMTIGGSISAGKYEGSIGGDLVISELNMPETNLHLMKSTNINLDLLYRNDSINISTVKVQSDGLKLDLSGHVDIKNNPIAELKIEGSNWDFSELSKYIPLQLRTDFGLKNISGILNYTATISGPLNDSVQPSIHLDFFMQDGLVRMQDYPMFSEISVKGNVDNGYFKNMQSTTVSIEKLNVSTKNSNIQASIELRNLNKPIYKVETKTRLNLADFSEYIPDTLLQDINGIVEAKLHTFGQLPDSITDAFTDKVMQNTSMEVVFNQLNLITDSLSIRNMNGSIGYQPGQFDVLNLSLSVPEYDVALKNSHIKTKLAGNLSDLDNMNVEITSMHLEQGKTKLSGKSTIHNLNNPTFDLTTKLFLSLDEYAHLMPDTLVKSISGTMEANLQSYGTINLDSIERSMDKIMFSQSKLDLKLRNINASMVDTLMEIKALNGIVNVIPDTVFISDFNGIFSGMLFEMDSIKIANYYNTLIENRHEELYVQGMVNLGDLNYAYLEQFIPSDTTSVNNTELESSNEDAEPINFTYLARGKIRVNSVTYNKVLLEDISMLFKASDSVYVVDQFKFNAFEGSMNNSFKYVLKPDGRAIINAKNSIKNMDIKKLLYDFDNFEQDSLITYENLSGRFTGDFNSQLTMVADSLVTKDMRVRGELKLEDGGIYNYEPAMEMSKFTGIKELDNIEFSTLESNIFILKGASYVPETHIVSTAMDISAYGMQSFGEDYEYHVAINLGDVLTGKSKNLLKRQSEMSDVASESNRSQVNLRAYSLDGKAKNGFDNKNSQTKMKLKIKTQERALKLIFHPKIVSYQTGYN